MACADRNEAFRQNPKRERGKHFTALAYASGCYTAAGAEYLPFAAENGTFSRRAHTSPKASEERCCASLARAFGLVCNPAACSITNKGPILGGLSPGWSGVTLPAMPNTFDPYREALVVETNTNWPDDLADAPRGEASAGESLSSSTPNRPRRPSWSTSACTRASSARLPLRRPTSSVSVHCAPSDVMETISVHLGQRSYEIEIGSGEISPKRAGFSRRGPSFSTSSC